MALEKNLASENLKINTLETGPRLRKLTSFEDETHQSLKLVL